MDHQKDEYKKLGLKVEEYEKIIEFLGREPNYLELSLYSVMWSEHCSYKSSKELLKQFKTTGKFVIQGPGENAGICDIGDGQSVVFKIESHNHPSAVEPYQGAATGIGGIIRDIFAMGARPICSLNSLRFGKLDKPRVKYLFENVVKGIGDYGNCMGIPTIGGEVYFDTIYEGNPLVNAMSVGIAENDQLIKSRAHGCGNYLVLIGSSTGRDGIHGATFASDELNEESEARRPSVQVGDPFMEKVVMEVCLELIKKKLIIGLQDMGAAGMTSSSVEMASKGDVGLDIDVSRVPLREPSMLPYEILISESQERMVVLVQPKDYEAVKEICKKWNINCAQFAIVTDTKKIRVYDKDELVGEVPVKTLTDLAPICHHSFKKPDYMKKLRTQDITNDEYNELLSRYSCNEIFKKMMSSPNVCSKKWVWEQYDHMVQTNTVVLPGDDASIIRIKDKDKALAFSSDGNGRYCYLNPFMGGIISVCESVRNLACSGAITMAITDCLNFGTPEKPEIFWQLKRAIEGMSKACDYLDVPVVSGNVSLYNESFGNPIYPTPVVVGAGLIKGIKNITSNAFKNEGDLIILLGKNKVSMGGSEFMSLFFDRIAGNCPTLNLGYEKRLHELILNLIEMDIINSAHDCSIGGIGVTIAESALLAGLGADIEIDLLDANILKTIFNETQSRIIISIHKDSLEVLRNQCNNSKIDARLIGTVKKDRLLINNQINIDIIELADIYNNTLDRIMSI